MSVVADLGREAVAASMKSFSADIAGRFRGSADTALDAQHV